MIMDLVQLQAASPIEPDVECEDELHDVNAIIMGLCVALGDTRAFEFRVAGFGDDRWPVDVVTDLATVLEQVPEALRACCSRRHFEVRLFEQGVQRELQFVPRGDAYEVRCVSATDWRPQPQVEVMASHSIVEMLSGLKGKFCEICERLLPRTSAHPWFREYAKGKSSESAEK